MDVNSIMQPAFRDVESRDIMNCVEVSVPCESVEKKWKVESSEMRKAQSIFLSEELQN